VLTVRLQVYHDAVSDGVCVGNPVLVLPLVVLSDKLLLTLFDVIPVGLEGDIEEGVSSEH